MKSLKWLSVLMIITILVIAGFQVYWLNENYKKEQKALEFRMHFTFRETINKLQAVKLKIDKIFTDSLKNIRLEVRDDVPPGLPPRIMPKRKMVSMVNVLGEKLSDSMRKTRVNKQGVVISLKNENILHNKDSIKEFNAKYKGYPGEIFKILYDVDSLQEPIRISEIDSAYREALGREHINVSFTITSDSTDSFREEQEDIMQNRVTVGFAKPITYRMESGNTFGFIMRKLSSPILFSLFLVGVTILSFVLLYRNLLQQRRLAEIKNEFISNITHELKTPIATVSVAIEALRNFNAIDNPQRSKDYLDISQNELNRLSLLVDKVLKLSMFEKKEIELKLEDLNLKDLVEEVTASMRLQIEKYNAMVSITAEGDLNMEADRLHIQSVIFNMLDNALKYSNGKPVIQVMLKQDNDKVVMSVKDNGIGIPGEYHGKLFEKFFRVPAGNTHNAKGYGLGLSYVAHVVKKHKGTITVDSQPGAGTTFIITVPKHPV